MIECFLFLKIWIPLQKAMVTLSKTTLSQSLFRLIASQCSYSKFFVLMNLFLICIDWTGKGSEISRFPLTKKKGCGGITKFTVLYMYVRWKSSIKWNLSYLLFLFILPEKYYYIFKKWIRAMIRLSHNIRLSLEVEERMDREGLNNVR